MPPRLARLVAIVAAIGLVVAALAIRSALQDDDAPSDGPDGPTATTDPDQPSTGDGDGRFRLACDADLAMTCISLRSVGEVEVLTGAEALDGDLSVDAWLTLDPMPAVRAYVDQSPEPDPDEVVRLGSATIVLYQNRDRVGCADGAARCIVEAGAGSADLGVPSGNTSAGILVRAGLTMALTPDIDRTGVEDLADEDRSLLRSADDHRPAALRDQATTFVTAAGNYGGLLTTDRFADDNPRNGHTAVPLVPELTLGVVVVGYGTRGADAAAAVEAAVTRETLIDDGFDGEPRRSSGIPAADIVLALRRELG